MKALVCHTITPDFSGTEIRDIETTEPAPDDVLVKIYHASVNYPDLLMCQGLYQHKPELPFTPGINISGQVAALGKTVSHLKEGDAVVGMIRTGGFAEYATVHHSMVRTAPGSLDSAETAAYPTPYLTAYVSLVRKAQLRPAETVLIHGASGGVGLATVDLAKQLGATVIATSGADWKLGKLKAYGADHALRADGFAARVKELTDGRGADVVLDPVGGDVFDESTHCIAFDGRLLVVGFTSGRFATVKSNITLIKGFSVIGVRAGEYGRRFPEKGRENTDAVWRLANEGKIRPYVHAEIPLERTLEAFGLLRNRSVVGKVVIRCD